MKKSDDLSNVRILFGLFVFFIAFLMISGGLVVVLSGGNDVLGFFGLPSLNDKDMQSRLYMILAAVSIGFVSAVAITIYAVKNYTDRHVDKPAGRALIRLDDRK